jgi:nucleoside-diphosphate-sugar epimerase
MVYECTTEFPSPEGAERRSPPPLSTYGFQKLACEYFAQGAKEQYGLPYTIIRPFNCVGTGEQRALSDKEIKSGNVSLAMSHVVPDLVQKVVKGQNPLRILGDGKQVRHYTYGGDLAKGIRVCVEHPAALNDDFNLSTPVGHTVLQVAEEIWNRVNPGQPFRYESDDPYQYDVQLRVPSVEKAKRVLGFEATTPLARILDEVVPWVSEQTRLGNI